MVLLFPPICNIKNRLNSIKRANFAPLPPKAHTPAVPFLSIGDYIVAVYQKKGNKTEYLAAPIVEHNG